MKKKGMNPPWLQKPFKRLTGFDVYRCPVLQPGNHASGGRTAAGAFACRLLCLDRCLREINKIPFPFKPAF